MRQQAIESPEFPLLVSCCRWNFSGGESPRPQPPAKLDWERFTALARRHRVSGLAWNALAENGHLLPESSREALSTDSRSIAAANLAIAMECRQLADEFERARVSLLFVKGLTVAALAYRSPLLKMAWDIDLLIDPDGLEDAAKLLAGRGYAVSIPPRPEQVQDWHRRSKESVWHRDGSFHVELHTRLPDNHRLIPSLDVHSPRQTVEVAPSVSLSTLAEEELVAYLAVHGASSAWFRLKWISDFAALVHGKDGKDLETLYRRSQQLGAARAAGQALLLADALFGTLQPSPGLRNQLNSDRPTRLLKDAALRAMTAGLADPTDRPLGTLAIHWTQFLLDPGIDFKISELRRQAGALLNRPAH